MHGDKLMHCKHGLNFVLELLGEKDRLSLACLEDHAYVYFQLTACSEANKPKIRSIISNLVAKGGTNIELGLDAGLAVLRDRRAINSLATVILLTDGFDNEPGTLLSRIEGLLSEQSAYSSEFTINCIGYGSNHDSSLLLRIAELKGGDFYYVEEPCDIGLAFATIIGGISSVISEGIQVTLEELLYDPGIGLGKIYEDTGSFIMIPTL